MLENIINKWEIPTIEKEEVNMLFKRIKPILRKDNGNFFLIEDVDPFKTSFAFNPKYKKKVKTKKLVEVGSAFSLHSSHPSLWKPSMEEVFAFIQNHPYIEDTNVVSIEFIDHHKSGNGNIGKITLYKIL